MGLKVGVPGTRTTRPVELHLHHRTDYRYDRPVFLNPHCIRLRPVLTCAAEIMRYRLKVWPEPVQMGWQRDPLNNQVAQVSFGEPTQSLTLHVNFSVRFVPSNPFNFVLEPWALQFPFAYPEPMERALRPCLGARHQGQLLSQLVQSFQVPQSTLDVVLGVNRWVSQNLHYQERMEAGIQEPEETLQLGQATCRDQAWLAIHVFRHLGLAARFVSGYLLPQRDPYQARIDRVGGGELHAWAEVYLPGAGWVGLDTTSGVLASATHIALACAPEPGGTAPLEGNLGYSGETPNVVGFSHHVSIRTDHSYRKWGQCR